MDSAARHPLDSTTIRVAPVRGADSACPLRWMLARTALSTRTTDGMIVSDGPSVTSTVPVSVTGTSAVITAAAADTDGRGQTVTREFLSVSLGK